MSYQKGSKSGKRAKNDVCEDVPKKHRFLAIKSATKATSFTFGP